MPSRVRQAMSRNIFQAINKHNESMFRLNVIKNVGLLMLLLLHQGEKMTLKHKGKKFSQVFRKLPVGKFVIGDVAYFFA